MVLLAEIVMVRITKDKKISLIELIVSNWQYEEKITEQELEIRKLNDLLTIQQRRR